MFSLQTIFGKGDKFYGLLEQSAAAAVGLPSAQERVAQRIVGEAEPRAISIGQLER